MHSPSGPRSHTTQGVQFASHPSSHGADCRIGLDDAVAASTQPASSGGSHAAPVLDLLAAWQLLRELPNNTARAYQAELELRHLLAQVFKPSISAHLFERAMRLRSLHMGFLASMQRNPKWQWASATLVDSLREEARLVGEAKERDEEALSLFWQWQNDRELWQRSESLVTIDTQDTLFTPNLFLQLQQALMKRVADRRAIIETLPCSNVRISQYQRFEEHHALRWMGTTA